MFGALRAISKASKVKKASKMPTKATVTLPNTSGRKAVKSANMAASTKGMDPRNSWDAMAKQGKMYAGRNMGVGAPTRVQSVARKRALEEAREPMEHKKTLRRGVVATGIVAGGYSMKPKSRGK